MTQEDKELLLKDLCARLPYHCRVSYEYVDDLDGKTYGYSITLNTWCIDEFTANKAVVKPYLRPLSSMTDSEKEYYYGLTEMKCTLGYAIDKVRFCLEHHLDMNNLIPKGLALEAPKNMYTHFGDMKVEITVEHKDVYNLKHP